MDEGTPIVSIRKYPTVSVDETAQIDLRIEQELMSRIPEIKRIMARAGASVVLAARRVERLKELRAEIEAEGGEAHVVFSHEGPGYRADCTAHLDSGLVLKAQGDAVDAHRAFEVALNHLEKQIRRYKRKIRNHREKTKLPRDAGV